MLSLIRSIHHCCSNPCPIPVICLNPNQIDVFELKPCSCNGMEYHLLEEKEIIISITSFLYPAYLFTILSVVLILAPFNLVLSINHCALIKNTNKEQNTQTTLFSFSLFFFLFFFFIFLLHQPVHFLSSFQLPFSPVSYLH